MDKSSFIFYIDDDEDDMRLFSSALKEVDNSFSLYNAANGKEGIEKLLLLNKENQSPFIIVMDLNMPAMNGKDTFLALKRNELLNKIPIVIFTTSDNLRDTEFFQKFDVKMITKPSSFSSLVTILQELTTYSI